MQLDNTVEVETPEHVRFRFHAAGPTRRAWAYLIDLLWPGDAPVVVTGAMRNPSLAGPDGPANLLAAMTVAASDRFRGYGALVVLNDEVHAARYVRKTHSTNTATFASPNAGPVGLVVEGEAVAMFGVARRRTHSPTGPVSSRVPIVAVGMGEDATALTGLGQNCDGLVVAGFGAGHVPDVLAEPVGALAQRVPVVLASRTGAGPVLAHTYGFTGSYKTSVDDATTSSSRPPVWRISKNFWRKW